MLELGIVTELVANGRIGYVIIPTCKYSLIVLAQYLNKAYALFLQK